MSAVNISIIAAVHVNVVSAGTPTDAPMQGYLGSCKRYLCRIRRNTLEGGVTDSERD